MLIADFVYNNVKNANIFYILFKLNYGYYPCICFENKTNSCWKVYLANKLVEKLRDLILICQQNLFNIQEVQKKVYDKGVQSKNYIYHIKKFDWIVTILENSKMESLGPSFLAFLSSKSSEKANLQAITF